MTGRPQQGGVAAQRFKCLIFNNMRSQNCFKMKKNGLLPLLLFTLAQVLPGQKMLLLEKANRVRPQKFYIGEQFVFRLKDEDFDFWQSAEITNIFPEEKSIELDFRKVQLEQISQVKLRKWRIYKAAGTQLMVFGGAWMGFSTVGLVFDNEPFTRRTYVVTGTSLAAGFTLRQIFKHRKIRLGKRHRLRAIEISFPKF